MRRGEKRQSIAELLNQETMRESNAAEKLDSEIRWLACHTDQAHPIPGKRLVRMTINGRVANFYGEAFALFWGMLLSHLFRICTTIRLSFFLVISVFRPSRKDYQYCLRIPRPSDPPQGPNPPDGIPPLA